MSHNKSDRLTTRNLIHDVNHQGSGSGLSKGTLKAVGMSQKGEKGTLKKDLEDQTDAKLSTILPGREFLPFLRDFSNLERK